MLELFGSDVGIKPISTNGEVLGTAIVNTRSKWHT